MTTDETKSEEMRLILSALLLAARLVNKPPGPSDEDIVRSAVRFADLLIKEVDK